MLRGESIRGRWQAGKILRDGRWSSKSNSYGRLPSRPSDEPSRYIVYDAGEADFWKGLEADLNPEEHDMPWESVLLKRWPNLKAVVERTSQVPQDANCPVHQVWISSKNSLKSSNGIRDNTLDGVSRLIYGSTLSVMGKIAQEAGVISTRLTTNLEIKKRLSLLRCDNTSFQRASLMSDVPSGDSPSTSPSEASRLTDDCSYGFDLYVLSDESANIVPRLYGSAELVAPLCWLSREALQSPALVLQVECEEWIQLRYWLEAVSFVHLGRLSTSRTDLGAF
jgi:hypothetical protein